MVYTNIVRGTSGDDNIYLGYTDQYGKSVQYLYSLTGSADAIFAGAGDDVINGGHGNDVIYGGLGNDRIYGGKGNNSLYGGEGNDRIYTGVHTSTAYGGNGDDLLYALLSKGGDHVLNGGAGVDTFRLAWASTTKTSNVTIEDFAFGEDILEIEGQTIDFSNLPTGITMALDDAFNIVLQFSDDETVTLVRESAQVPSMAGITVNGTAGDDVITTKTTDPYGNTVTQGNDVVMAGEGNDLIKGYGGADLVFGGDGNDRIYGDKGENILYGDAGDDYIHTGRDTSIAYGGDGDDTLYGLLNKGGDHILNGGAGADTFIFAWASTKRTSNVTVEDFDFTEDVLKIQDQTIEFANLPSGVSMSMDAERNIVLEFSDDETITLNRDTAPATALAGEIVSGTSGNDSITTLTTDANGKTVTQGDDIVMAGAGDDVIKTEGGADLVFGGDGNDKIYGVKGHNTLFGDAGNDKIYVGRHTSSGHGGDGDDLLYAHINKGADHILSGGAGADTFIFAGANTIKTSNVTIEDFNRHEDTLIIDSTEIDFNALEPGMSFTLNDDNDAVLHFSDDETITFTGNNLADLGIGILIA